MRRGFILTLTLLLALATQAATWQFTVLHTNDLHGMMQPFKYFSLTGLAYARDDAGGLARRATAIAQIRRQLDHPSILVDAGDIFTRGPWHQRFYGAPEVEAYNQMGYELSVVGNNEFKGKDGPESQAVLLGLMRRSRFPWLAANLTVGETGVPVEGIHPYVVRTYGDIRVGFLGLTAPRASDYPQTKGWTISDPIMAAKQWVPQARQECDILIAVTHIGVDLDKQLAAAVPGIDAIVGGDSHTFIPTPVMVKGPEGRDVPIVQAGEQGVMLGQLDLTFTDTDGWHLQQATGKLIPIDKTYTDDPAIKSLLDHWLSPAKVGTLCWGWAA